MPPSTSARSARDQATASDPLRALFDAAREGDEQAVRDLCVRIRPFLFRAARAVVRDDDDADDVAQLALVRGIDKRAPFDGRGSVAGFLRRIAVNLAKNFVRSERRRHAASLGARVDDAGDDPFSIAAQKEIVARFADALATLPRRQRDVVALRVVDELDFDAIGAQLGITAINARVSYLYGRRKIARALEAPTASAVRRVRAARRR